MCLDLADSHAKVEPLRGRANFTTEIKSNTIFKKLTGETKIYPKVKLTFPQSILVELLFPPLIL